MRSIILEDELKINSGDIVAIAEVVRDLHKNVDDPDHSYSERMIYEAALERIASEVSAVEGVDTAQATIKVVAALRLNKKPVEEAA